MGFDDERHEQELRAWYGGGYNYDPPPPPPDAVVVPGPAAPSAAEWSSEHFKPSMGRRAGDALVLGRFLPFHRGHVHLLSRALGEVAGRLHVVVAGRSNDFVPRTLRVASITDVLPKERTGTVTSTRDVGQQGTPAGDDFWQPWLDWLATEKWSASVKTLVAGEPGAERFAKLAGFDFVLVDRAQTPNGTAIRNAPWKHWDEISPRLRPYFGSSVALVGPEGAGKSTLAKALTTHYGTSCASEYLPDWLASTGQQLPTQSQLATEVWDGQRGGWTRAGATARRFFIADTDHLTLAIWAVRLFNTPIRSEPMRQGLTLLLDDATPWKGAKERDEPEARKHMVLEFRRLLSARGWPFHVLDGPREGRFEQAVKHIDAWIRSNPIQR